MINVGVIGAGPWGRNHIRVYHESEKANLLAISDSNEKVFPELKERFKIEPVKDYQEILNNEKIQAISICLPASMHYKICKEALEKGKHILVEKPLTLNSKEGQELIKIAKDNNLILAVGQIFRFDPTIKKTKEEIKKGTFGKIHFMNLARMGLARPREDVGAILNYAVHDFDIMCDILDIKMPDEITSISINPLNRDFEDFAIVTAKFNNKTLGYSQVSWLPPKKIRDFWLIGEKASASIDTMKFEIEIFESGIIPDYHSFGTFQLIKKEGNSYKPQINKAEPLLEELNHFIDCIENKKQPINCGEVGLRAVKMAEAAILSAKQNKTIFLDQDGNPK